MHVLCKTRDGTRVYVDLIHSEAAQGIARHPQLLGIIKEVLAHKTLSGADVQIEHDMGRTVGYDFIVDTSDSSLVFYARILHDDIYTRFVKNGRPSLTQYVTFTLRSRDEGDGYELRDVRIGRMIPPRPGAPDEVPASREYWGSHALIHDSQVLQSHTATKTCPY